MPSRSTRWPFWLAHGSQAATGVSAPVAALLDRGHPPLSIAVALEANAPESHVEISIGWKPKHGCHLLSDCECERFERVTSCGLVTRCSFKLSKGTLSIRSGKSTHPRVGGVRPSPDVKSVMSIDVTNAASLVPVIG